MPMLHLQAAILVMVELILVDKAVVLVLQTVEAGRVVVVVTADLDNAAVVEVVAKVVLVVTVHIPHHVVILHAPRVENVEKVVLTIVVTVDCVTMEEPL